MSTVEPPFHKIHVFPCRKSDLYYACVLSVFAFCVVFLLYPGNVFGLLACAKRKIKVKLSLLEVVEAHRFLRRRGSHIFYTIGSHMAVRLSALRPRRFLVLIYVRGCVNPMVIVRLEGLGQLKNVVAPSGNETATFRLVVYVDPQPSTLPRAPRAFVELQL
jgi:hypothetical protein